MQNITPNTTPSNKAKIDLKTGNTITLENAKDKITFYKDSSGTTCINCIGLEIDGQKIKAKQADSLTVWSATSTKVFDFDGKIPEKTFTFATADQVIIGSTIINKLMVSTFTTDNNQIKSAILFTSQNNNDFTLYCNSIPFQAILSQQQSIHMNCTTKEGKSVEDFSIFTKNEPKTEKATKVIVQTKLASNPLSFENTEKESSFNDLHKKQHLEIHQQYIC